LDSNRYRLRQEKKNLPAMTFELDLPGGSITGINIADLVFRKKIDVDRINFNEARVKLARHSRKTAAIDTAELPLWKLIQPGIQSIKVGRAACENLKLSYQNAEDQDNFRWQFDECDVAFMDLRVDSASANDSTRLLFAKDIALAAKNIKMKTADGLYNLAAQKIRYSSRHKDLEAAEFSFQPAISDAALIRHFGYQHEIYKLRMPRINVKNFLLHQWINNNQLQAREIELLSPEIAVSMDRNAPPNTRSKKGQYPHQLVQKAPFGIDVRKVKVRDGKLVYTEKNNKNQLTGRLVFSAMKGTINNITNLPGPLSRSNTCRVDVSSAVLSTGFMKALFRFNLADKAGAFSVNATINKLDADQLQPLAKAMTSTDLQSFNMHQLHYSLSGNQNAGIGELRMHYDNMDILINQVEPDGSLDKKGLLSFFANRFAIYKENPMSNGDERKAEKVAVQRVATRSFFNFIWKTLYTSAGEIVLRPAAQRKIERRKQRAMEP
ncbi:MAG TPA: hypothetical protein VFX58_19125, partial [Chitinophagaceae bacterium]|nr:hypothetical protein [Chitinophagaceae bacterium]